MASADGIPALLAPLMAECSVMAGGVAAAAAAKAIGAALGEASARHTIAIRAGRGVFEVRTAAGPYVVKAYEAGLMARMSALRFCASGREWRALEAAVKAGIRTAPPVGLVSGKGVNFVIIAKLTGTAELESYLLRERERLLEDVKLGRALVTAFAQFMADLHRAGLLHHDLHLRNLLVRPPRKGAPAEFFVLDLAEEALSEATPLEHARLQNLAQLSLGFQEVPQTARRRFLREYRRVMGDGGDERLAARAIELQAAELQFNRNTLRVATCADAGAAIARVERRGTVLLIDRGAENADLAQLEAPLSKADPVQWPAVLSDHFELRLGEGCVWKLRSPLADNSAENTRRRLEALWGRLMELKAIGVRAPAPLACLVQGQDILVFGAIPGPLEDMARHRGHDELPLYEGLARDVLRMHRYGCFFLPMEPAQTAQGLMVAKPVRGGQTLVLCAPDHIFRGAPNVLGQQAVASLGRVARAVTLMAGERAMKELVWAYARVLRLAHGDTSALLDEARRVPTGNTLVMTRGIERTRAT